MPPNSKRCAYAKRDSLSRSTRARSAALASAARRAAPVRAGADDDNDSEDGRVFEDDLEEGDESDSHGGGGGGGVPAGGGDESDSEDCPGDAGGVPAIHGQPVDLLAQLPGYRGVRVRLFLGGLPLAAGLLGQAALGDPAPPRAPPPACEHCHTIPYQKGVCCSNVGVRTECPKCHAMVWQGTLSMQCRVHCLCSAGCTVYAVQGALSMAQCTLSMYSGALSMCTGGTVHVHRGHCPCAQGAISMCAGCTMWNPPPSPLTTTIFTPIYPQPYICRYMRKVGNVHVNSFPSPPFFYPPTLPGSVRAQSTTP